MVEDIPTKERIPVYIPITGRAPTGERVVGMASFSGSHIYIEVADTNAGAALSQMLSEGMIRALSVDTIPYPAAPKFKENN